MKILFTGSSSFTGCWFISELVERGHDVTAVFTQSRQAYEGIRKKRLEENLPRIDAKFECRFGDQKFVDLIRSGAKWDLLAHHGADVTNYHSHDFDAIHALRNNACNLRQVMQVLNEVGCEHILLTGSVFEPNEGVGAAVKNAFSPYGLSKGLTSEYFKFFSDYYGLSLGKFVIPNPFGVYEEPRFTNYLCKTWAENQTPSVRTPDYVRDNIHVSLLAKAYAEFADKLVSQKENLKANPSGYVETQGAFARRFAREIGKRVGRELPVELGYQQEFDEPRVRFNSQPAKSQVPHWNETKAWDDIAGYYSDLYHLI